VVGEKGDGGGKVGNWRKAIKSGEEEIRIPSVRSSREKGTARFARELRKEKRDFIWRLLSNLVPGEGKRLPGKEKHGLIESTLGRPIRASPAGVTRKEMVSAGNISEKWKEENISLTSKKRGRIERGGKQKHHERKRLGRNYTTRKTAKSDLRGKK